MKIYQLHEYYGEYEDYFDHIVGSFMRRECAEEGHETRDNDGQAAVFLEEVIELGHALGSEGLDLARVDDARTEETRDPVVGRVSQDGRRVEHDKRDREVEAAAVGREHASREQQAIARQEREDHHARLDEDDQEQRRVNPDGAQCHDPAGDSRARVVKQVQYEVDKFHPAHYDTRTGA